MTAHKVPELSGRPADELLDTLRAPLTGAILERLVRELPVYAQLPRDVIAEEISRACAQGMRMFGAALRTGELDERVLGRARRGAARRAEDLVPLAQLLAAYGVGVEVCHERLIDLAGPDDLENVVELQRLSFRFLREVGAALAEGYTEAHETLRDDELAGRHALLDALLAGEDPDAAATQAGIRLPATYLVVALSPRVARDAAADGEVLARRTSRLLRQVLFRRTHGAALCRLSPTGGIALLPAEGPCLDAGATDWTRLRELLDAAAHQARTELTAAAVPAAPVGVAAAGRLATELVELAGSLGSPPGLYRLDDLALEYQLTRPSPARELIAAMLGSVRGEPQLLVTLRAFLANDLSRRRTAAELRVHPNTVDNRLRKVATLTGLDVARRTDLPRIAAALTALEV